MTYIALLRGINVGGHNVKMGDLRKLFVDLGFSNVRSYIQSGNVFFDCDEKKELSLQKKIEEYLEKSLGFAVPVCLRTVGELEEVLALDPFKKIELTPDVRFAVTFLSEPVTTAIPTPYITLDGGYELIKITPTELYVVWHLKDGRPANSYGKLEKQVSVPGTTRFWHTTKKILEAAKKS